jgi:aminoglycoside phosphotransferase (APT) family kinase protein
MNPETPAKEGSVAWRGFNTWYRIAGEADEAGKLPLLCLHGEALTHCDVRSDNLCFLGDRVVLVDWNLTRQGHPSADLASWLPSLETEGGPAPETILPQGAPFAALLSGYFASRAGRPIIPDAPLVRKVQLEQLHSALPWAVRALGLPPLDGPRAG